MHPVRGGVKLVIGNWRLINGEADYSTKKEGKEFREMQDAENAELRGGTRIF